MAVDIKSLNQQELEEFLVSLGEKSFRAKQIYQWLHVRHAADLAYDLFLPPMKDQEAYNGDQYYNRDCEIHRVLHSLVCYYILCGKCRKVRNCDIKRK